MPRGNAARPAHNGAWLLFLQRMPGISQGALAEQMDVEPITACRMVDRLEQAGLVERRRDPRDRSRMAAVPHRVGGTGGRGTQTIGMEMLDWVTSDLTEEEEALVCSYLMKIRDRFALLDERKQVRETSNG
jgi:hypothetical protein